MPLSLHKTLGWLLVVATLYCVGFVVPPAERILGSNYLIFFFHFPSAINCLNFFIFGGVVAAIGLWRRFSGDEVAASRWDRLSVGAVEVGMLACTITLVTGGIWARSAWGEWDAWITSDPRLMSVYIMWFTYAGYLALRSSIEDPRKKEIFCSVFALIATINVPIVYFAIRIFAKAHHPMEVKLDDTSMIFTRWFGTFAFFVLYTSMWRLRRRVHDQRHELDRLEADLVEARM